MQMEDVYRIDQGIDRYMTKTQKKTADFMEGCMELGGLLGGWSSDEIMYLKRYGHALGMRSRLPMILWIIAKPQTRQANLWGMIFERAC